MQTLDYELMTRWPPGAWLATCEPRGDRVVVQHGSRVEAQPRWFGELVWDGEYSEGRFDETDIVYGSGGRAGDAGILFVGSASATDRLHHYTRNDGAVLVSNSLACLLAASCLQLSPATAFPQFFTTIIRGIESYETTLPTDSANGVELTYYRNLHWDGERVTRADKPLIRRGLTDYTTYREVLRSMLARLFANSHAAERTHPLKWLSNISSGFDSTTVTVAAREVGLQHTLSFNKSRHGRADDGAAVAKRLGLSPTTISSSAWREQAFAEVPFLASDGKGEDVYFGGADDTLGGVVLLSGYGASPSWGTDENPSKTLTRTDQSGLSHTENRLWKGYIHAPIGQAFFRQADDMRAITHSAEMQKWHTGKAYDKPICRRMIEEAGVPRSEYAQEKSAASILLSERHSFLTPESLADYTAWCASDAGRRWGCDSVTKSTLRQTLLEPCRWSARRIRDVAILAEKNTKNRFAQRILKSPKLSAFANFEPRFFGLFPWALEKAISRYQ